MAAFEVKLISKVLATRVAAAAEKPPCRAFTVAEWERQAGSAMENDTVGSKAHHASPRLEEMHSH